MGKVRSVRLNESAERMFNVVKTYYEKHGGITDSEIFVNGIKSQYDLVVEDLNTYFKDKMKEYIEPYSLCMDVFERICDILEVLSVAQGSTLQSEFYDFLIVNAESALLYDVDSESKERFNKNSQYEKVWESVQRAMKQTNTESLCECLDSLDDTFKSLFKNE